MLTRTPKQPKPQQSSFDTLFEEFGETPPYDIRPPSERNDYLQSSVGKDRANRREDVATAARLMPEIGDISRKDAAINGDLMPTFEAGVERMQARAKRDNPDVTVDRVYGRQTQAITLEIERPKARARRAEINAGIGNLLLEPGERPPAPKPIPIDAAAAKQLIQNQLAVRRAE